MLHCSQYLPETLTDDETKGPSWKVPARSGSLRERLVALRDAEMSARASRKAASVLCHEQLRLVQEGIQDIVKRAQAWPQSEATMHSGGLAIPEGDRPKAPGVPGELVHWEGGYRCIVQNLPVNTNVLVAGMDIQALAADQLRVQALTMTERYSPEGTDRREHWRARQTAPIASSRELIQSILCDLGVALEAARAEFDKSRFVTDGWPVARRPTAPAAESVSASPSWRPDAAGTDGE